MTIHNFKKKWEKIEQINVEVSIKIVCNGLIRKAVYFIKG